MKLFEYEGKKVQITTNEGETFKGLANDYTPADENNPEIESICIGEFEFYANNIKNIELL